MELNLETNKGPEAAAPGVSTSDAEAFKKTIEESKEKIQAADEKILPKRGRGQRGPGRKKLNAKPQASAQSETIQSVNVDSSPAPSIAPLITPPLLAISKIPASKHNIPELALTPEEAELCANCLNELVQAFVPDLNKMDPKTAAVSGAIMVFGSIFFQKYTIYANEMKKRESEKKKEEIQDEPLPRGNNPLGAESYFGGVRRV